MFLAQEHSTDISHCGVLTNKEGLAGNVKAEGYVGCSDQEMVEIRILQGRNKTTNGIAILDFRRASCESFKDLLVGISWVRALNGKTTQESWLTFRYQLFPDQDQCTLENNKSGKGGRRPT